MSTALDRLVEAFNSSFLTQFNTRLVGGFDEPLYLPSVDGQPAEIRFTKNYLSSALHEISHWCIAGEGRRKLLDYGYWYRPDGRGYGEQLEFFQAEVKPQSLEKAFSDACGIAFIPSCDNLNSAAAAGAVDPAEFEKEIMAQLERYRNEGFPPRAAEFMELLAAQF